MKGVVSLGSLEMTSSGREAFLRQTAHLVPLLTCFCLLLGLLAGCNQQMALVSTTNMRVVPDKESYLQQRLQSDFTNPDLHCELGRHYQSEGLWDKARYHIVTALGLDPAHRQSQAANIKSHVAMGDEATADRLFAKYQRQLLASPVEMVKFAKALGEAGLDTFSLRSFDQAVLLAPQSAEAHRQLGYYYLLRRDIEQAKAYFTKSFEYDPAQADVAGELGKMGVVVEPPVDPAQKSQEIAVQ